VPHRYAHPTEQILSGFFIFWEYLPIFILKGTFYSKLSKFQPAENSAGDERHAGRLKGKLIKGKMKPVY
jgi:hypothetical protein